MVSIIIPCRNEEKFIGKCLDSIIGQDYPKENLEILVIDGMSEDGTRKNIEKYTEQHSFIKLLDNPRKITPCALNIGIKNAKGKIILWMSAHNSYEKDYVSKCVKYSKEYNADNVGGIMVTFLGMRPLSVKPSPPFYPTPLVWAILSLEQVLKNQNGWIPYSVAAIRERYSIKSGFSMKILFGVRIWSLI